MDSPFDDPEFLAQLAAMGVVYSPGSGQRVIDEMAPLLAAEGIDLDDLGDVDLDEVNAALARATERHNLALFTPVGAQREDALAVLREFAVRLADEQDSDPFAVLAAVETDPADGSAAISHVIGVALGLLDDWHTNPAWNAALAGTRLRRGPRPAQAAAKDLLALARKGRAFASLDRMHRGHSGLAIFQGSALLVADAVGRRAAAEGMDVPAVAERELTGVPRLRVMRGEGGAGSGSGAGSGAGSGSGAGRRGSGSGAGSAFGAGAGAGARGGASARGSSFVRPAAPEPPTPIFGRASGGSIRSRDQRLVRDFGTWLRRQEAIAAADPAQELTMFEALISLAREEELDLQEPEDVELMIDVVLDYDHDEPEADEAAEQALDTLHDYVHFRIETSADPEEWDLVHEEIELALDEVDPGRALVVEAVAATLALDPTERWAGLVATPVIAGVGELLEWIGAGQPVTSTGGVRRADIERVAGMISIAAVGVSKRTASEPGDPVQASSMYDVPMMAAWWEALQIAEIITISPTRVRPGAAAERWGIEGGVETPGGRGSSGARGGAGARSGAAVRGGAGLQGLAASGEGAEPAGIELAEQLIGLVVADLVTGAGMPAGGGIDEELIEARVEAVLMTVDPSREGPDISGLPMWQQYLVAGLIVDLARLGLVDPQGESGPETPVALKAAVAKGAVLAMAYFAAMNGLLE